MARSKKPKDYSKAKIYMIVCRKTGLVYIGSTTKQYLSQRLDTHRTNYKAWLNKTGNYCYSVLVLENEDYYIKLLQLYPCTCNDELRMKEQEYIDANECVNHNNSYTDKKEYDKVYREEHKEEHKEYRVENKEKIKEYNKVYNKVYYEENKEEINRKQNEKINCVCGCSIAKVNKLRHEKTNKHIKLINKQNTQ